MRPWLFIVCLLIPMRGMALEQMTLHLGTIKELKWQAEDVSVLLEGRDPQKLSLTLKVGQFSHADLKIPVQKLRIECPMIQLRPEKIACPQAQLLLLDHPVLKFSVTYQGDQTLDLNINNFNLAEGEIISQLKTLATGWQVNLKIKSINLEKFVTLLGNFIPLPTGLQLGGEATIELTAAKENHAYQIHLAGQAAHFTYTNASGSQAGEKLTTQLDIQASSTDEKDWQIQSTLMLTEGELYSDPVYVEVTHQPITLSLAAHWQTPQFNIHSFKYQQKNIVVLEGFSKLSWKDQVKIEQFTAQMRQGTLHPLYHNYLKPFLGEGKEVSGTIGGRIEWNPKNQQGQMNLSRVSIKDSKKGWGIQELNGEIQWHNQRYLPSHLAWSEAYLFSHLPLGKSQIRASFNQSGFKLLAPWEQPILDGAIHIEQFNLDNLGQNNMTWELRGQLHPISLLALTQLFNLPSLKGKVSAMIPPVRYRDHQLSTQGVIKMRIFDGEVDIPTLQIKEPFASTPLLKAEVNVNKINLETLTKVTEFGEIQGQLSGYIHDLSLVNWQPVSFDAYFATPKENTLPKKISQKAVNRLSHLGGGGATDLISRSVLKLFENFSYEQIGWGCRLQNKVCTMRGVETIGQSYYIVKGGGLPRIDVIGYNPQVDWNELLSRLKRLSQTQKPIIKNK